MKTIVFATDGSDSAKAAGEQVRAFLDAFPTAKVHVIHVIRPVYAIEGFGFSQDVVDDGLDSLAKAIEADVRVFFQNYQDRMEFTSISGFPAAAISQFADEVHADLIVVGSHGRGAFDRLLIGSVSNGIVHRAKVPVLVVK